MSFYTINLTLFALTKKLNKAQIYYLRVLSFQNKRFWEEHPWNSYNSTKQQYDLQNDKVPVKLRIQIDRFHDNMIKTTLEEIIPAPHSGPRKVDYHGDPQKDLKTCKSLHDKGLLENQNTISRL